MPADFIEQNLFVLEQGVALLRSLPDSTYRAEPDTAAPAIGPHVRHCLDFYCSFLDGLELGVIDYATRERQREIEVERSVAVEALVTVAERLARIPDTELPRGVQARLEPSDGDDPESEWSRSSVARELQFLLSHTVHHYALIALALRLGGHAVPRGFGVAPSTLRHWHRDGCVAR